jgi:16S rRNA C1402 (ribose-2'-O) methylase RsmI
MTEVANHQPCAYQQLENGIHEFIFYESSRRAIDSFFQQLEKILTATPHHETARYLVDITKGDREVSLVTMTQRFRKLEAQFPHRARGRTVILHKPGLLLAFIDNFIRALAPNRDATRFFPVDKRAEAIAWLLSE